MRFRHSGTNEQKNIDLNTQRGGMVQPDRCALKPRRPESPPVKHEIKMYQSRHQQIIEQSCWKCRKIYQKKLDVKMSTEEI